MVITSTGLGCGALGAQAVGRQFSFDRVRCGRCRRKLRTSEAPLWYDVGEVDRQAQCTGCARRRHVGCPCRYVERTEH